MGAQRWVRFSLALAAALSCGVCASLRGATPALRARLAGGGALRCEPLHGGGAVAIAAARVNDDFCDCRDGADEPGTAACANGSFWCANAAHRPARIPSSRVDDGVCDCCDGSDEPPGACPDRCAGLRAAALRVAAQKAARITAGVKKRHAYEQKAAADARKDAAELRRLRRELKEARAALDRAKARADALQARQVLAAPQAETQKGAEGEEEEEEEVPGRDGAGGVEEGVGEEGVGEEVGGDRAEAGIEDVEKGAEVEAEEMEMLEADAEREGERKVVTEPEQLPVVAEEVGEAGASGSEGVDNASASAAGQDLGPLCAELSGGEGNIVVRKLWMLFAGMAAKVQWIYPSLFKRVGLSAGRDLEKCVARAEKQRSEMEEKVRGIEDKIAELERRAGFNYGKNAALRPLHGKCVKKRVTQYEFEHCPFDVVRQYEDGRMIASLGKFERVHGEGEGMSMMYKNGDQCWNGPERSISVALRCGENDEIVSVDEPSRCTYAMVFETPAGCSEAAAERVMAEVTGGKHEEMKDEL